MFEEAAVLFARFISDQVSEQVKLFQLFEVQKLLAIEGKYKNSNYYNTIVYILNNFSQYTFTNHAKHYYSAQW